MREILIIILLIFLSSCSSNSGSDVVEQGFRIAETQTKVMLKEVQTQLDKARAANTNPEPVAPRTLEGNALVVVPSRDWTSGFFSGVLWYLHEYTGNDEWKEHAIMFNKLMEPEKLNGRTHDMGFKMYCSFGNGLRLGMDETYEDILIQSARTLATRFRPSVGVMRSWDHSREKWDFPVIIDNMMNLELLFLATRITGDSSFHKIARTHAETTMKNHFREDYSSYHVLDYDTLTGKVTKKNTHQGYDHESAWSRGQAWGLYGYTMCFRETGERTFLDQAEKIASYIFNHPNLPEDLIPYWDFDAPEIPREPRDVSAAAITASALFELSLYSDHANTHRERANTILQHLTKDYTSPEGENKGFVLLHSTGSKPSKSEVDVPLCYADYYYLEALLRKQKIDKGEDIF